MANWISEQAKKCSEETKKWPQWRQDSVSPYDPAGLARARKRRNKKRDAEAARRIIDRRNKLKW